MNSEQRQDAKELIGLYARPDWKSYFCLAK